MEICALKVAKRGTGKKAVSIVKKSASIPVVIYGPKMKENIAGAVVRNEMIKLLHTPQGKNVYLDLDVEGESIKAIPYQFDIDPVKNSIRHIDFLAVSPDDEVEAEVPVFKVGRSKGEVAGGMVMQIIKEVRIKAKPLDIPASITIDVTEFKIGTRLLISAIDYPAGVTPVFKQDTPVIVVNKGRGQKADSIEEED